MDSFKLWTATLYGHPLTHNMTTVYGECDLFLLRANWQNLVCLDVSSLPVVYKTTEVESVRYAYARAFKWTVYWYPTKLFDMSQIVHFQFSNPPFSDSHSQFQTLLYPKVLNGSSYTHFSSVAHPWPSPSGDRNTSDRWRDWCRLFPACKQIHRRHQC